LFSTNRFVVQKWTYVVETDTCA